MADLTSFEARYAQVLEHARGFMGTRLPDTEVLVIAGNVRRKPPALAGCLGLGGFYQRFLIVSRERFILMRGSFKPNQIELEKPLSSLRSMAIRKGDLVVHTDGEDVVFRFPLLNVGGAQFGPDVVTCLTLLGIPLEPGSK